MAVDSIVTPVLGMVVTKHMRLRSGVYHLADHGAGIVQVSGKNFILDCNGAKLVGPGTRKGIGIHITDASNVTVKNADVTGWQWGIVIERSSGVKLVDCVASRNADLTPGTVINESGQDPEDDHGGGIVIRDCRDCQVLRCTAQHQWDGIDVIRSTGCHIEYGDYSFNGNWGLHLWSSSHNAFYRNRAVWCTTGAGTLYQALTGWQTYDAQAVGIDHNSNENRIEGNDLRFSGDGIFIRANEGPMKPGTKVPPRNASNTNALLYNDCSFSPNNAIEVDFVSKTRIVGNNCSYSHYGLWLGYATNCVVSENICINDSANAVEIENGQDDVFVGNVFGYDTPRPEGQLIYLRQNGQDNTPSGPYQFTQDLFYGAERGVLLKATTAEFEDETIRWPGPQPAQIASGDAASRITEQHVHSMTKATPLHNHFVQRPGVLAPGELVHLLGGTRPADEVWAVEVDGIPVWLQRPVSNNSEVTFRMPDDLWDRPAKHHVTVRILGDGGWSEYTTAVQWPIDRARVDSIVPNPAKIGDTITITGANLGKSVQFNGLAATILKSSSTQLVVKLPESIITSTGYNLVVQGADHVKSQSGPRSSWPQPSWPQPSWPITFRVQVPDEQLPHLLSATFNPTTLKVGELLTVTFTVRNNLPIPVPLMTQPMPPYTYEEGQAWSDFGVHEVPHTLNLRVTSDHPGRHDPGSWPWLFGFDRPTLAPGETVTVTGRICVQTPGVHEFRVGLVVTGGRFIDDNAFRTRITIER
jgi:parallel beta-helix repeat protein